MIDAKEKWKQLSALAAAAEEDFINRIKVARPGITDDEIKKAFAAWWLEPRPPDLRGDRSVESALRESSAETRLLRKKRDLGFGSLLLLCLYT